MLTFGAPLPVLNSDVLEVLYLCMWSAPLVVLDVGWLYQLYSVHCSRQYELELTSHCWESKEYRRLSGCHDVVVFHHSVVIG